MAKNGRTKQSATTHQSPKSGHGPRVSRRPFARPVLRAPRGSMSPSYLKTFGSRTERAN